MLRAADAVVAGRVERIESVTNEEGTFSNVTLTVEQSLGAHVGSRVVLVEPSGETRAQYRWIFGSPTFYVGERVLVFVKQDRRGRLRTLYLGMGKFRIVRSSAGEEYAVQNFMESAAWNPRTRRLQHAFARSYRLEALLAQLKDARPISPRRLRKLTGVPARGPILRPRFALTGPPAVRWFAPDDGQTILFRIDPEGDASIGPHNSIQAAKDALQAWSEPACTDLRFDAEEQVEPAPFASCDGRSQILFNDPFGDIADPVDCVGVLGVGGICGAPGEPRPFAGSLFYPISEGDVIIANGFGECSFWNIPALAEILTHEIGHAIGLAHSSEDPNERNPLLADATMYYRAHFDYRGATLADDDRAAVCALYPANESAMLTFDRAAIIFDTRENPSRNRLFVEGTWRTGDSRWQPATNPFFLAVSDGARRLISAAVSPGEWLRSSQNNRLRWRARTSSGVVILDLVQRDAQTYDFTLSARTDAIQPPPSGSLTVSMTLGEASSTVPLMLRPKARLLHYP
ncbi:MAG: hypothetical protein KatS3mg077_1251 [Candidatus Binatia bacterium]|nr:MAG: hypothetical protein KatS3mg077_1251 [Candidatus Binatia bacterium]